MLKNACLCVGHFFKKPAIANLTSLVWSFLNARTWGTRGVQVLDATNHHEIRLLINQLMEIRFTSASSGGNLAQTNCARHALEVSFLTFSKEKFKVLILTYLRDKAGLYLPEDEGLLWLLCKAIKITLSNNKVSF